MKELWTCSCTVSGKWTRCVAKRNSFFAGTNSRNCTSGTVNLLAKTLIQTAVKNGFGRRERSRELYCSAVWGRSPLSWSSAPRQLTSAAVDLECLDRDRPRARCA